MAQKNIEINVKTATGYDQLYPKSKAEIITYDNTNSELAANTVQDAIDELETMVPSQEEKDDWNNKSDKAMSFTITLDSYAWEPDSKAQVAYLDAFLADGYAYMVSPASGYLVDYSKAQIYADEVTENGEMIFWCETVPTEDLEVNIVRMVVEDE